VTVRTVAAGLDPAVVDRLADLALTEDLAGGSDITTEATVPADAVATGDLVARRPGVVAGLPVARAVFEKVLTAAGLAPQDAAAAVVEHVADGTPVAPGDVLLTVTGPARAVLTGERSALNLVGQLSGVATLTARWVEAVAGTGANVRDTRKTVPGMRAAQKYAVRCGGGSNHRMGLNDQALVKDNHLLAAGGVTAALDAVRALHPDVVCEVECDTIDQVVEAVAAGARLVLLDNMDVATMRRCVEVARPAGVRTEASGSLRLDDAREVALTGVDFLAVGALTHSAPVLDIGLDLRP
jgi:nicotinate-nucleotide pyrophosphorylase (carboxylating)